MPRYLIMPWLDAAELLRLRQNLYWRGDLAGDGDGDDRRHAAVDTVAAWKRRTPLPHAIESTASLVDATLHDESPTVSALAVRNAYCAAFNRFVTGFCDTVQTSFKKMSMYDMAAELDMPSSFVELRHEATHEELPSLRRLQMAAEQALEWLWQHYWAKLDAAAQTSQDIRTPAADARADLHRILRAYLNNRRSEIRTFGASTHSKASSYGHDASRAIASLCQQHSHGPVALVSLLLDDRLIVPSDYHISERLDGAFLIWDPVLCALDSELYLEAFVEHAVAILASPSAVDAKNDSSKAAIFEWLRHIIVENGLSIQDQVMSGVQALAMTCCMAQPVLWCRRLAKTLLVQGDDNFQDEWLPILEASLPDTQGSPNDDSAEASCIPAGGLSGVPAAADEGHMQDIAQAQQAQPSRRGWKMWEANWQPMPIGLVPT